MGSIRDQMPNLGRPEYVNRTVLSIAAYCIGPFWALDAQLRGVCFTPTHASRFRTSIYLCKKRPDVAVRIVRNTTETLFAWYNTRYFSL
jgi:hypothetical protein